MRRHANFPLRFWLDHAPLLSKRQQDIYLRTVTHPESNALGLFVMPIQPLLEALNMTEKQFIQDLKALESRQLLFYDLHTQLAYLPGQIDVEFNVEKVATADNRRKWVQKIYDSLPLSPLLTRFWKDAGNSFALRPRDSDLVIQPEPVEEERSIQEDIDALLVRYGNKVDRVRETLDRLRLIRKTGKMAPSLVLRILQRWDKMEVDRVLYGIAIYLDKRYDLEGKAEEYLLGIMRRASEQEIQRGPRLTGQTQAVGMNRIAARNLAILEQRRKERERMDQGKPGPTGQGNYRTPGTEQGLLF